MSHRCRKHSFLTACFVLCMTGILGAQPPGQIPAAARTLTGEPATPHVALDQWMRVLWTPTPPRDEPLKVALERSRGISAEVFPKAAPAVVFLVIPTAHGTGFFISEDGWILTNCHVVDGAFQDPRTGFRRVGVIRGELKDGFMQVIDQRLTASVYKAIPEKDLALLKLDAMPPGVDELPYIKLAEDPPMIGMDCVAIGHPKRGMLWTVRSGEVAGVGMWPRDMIDNVVHWIASSGADREAIEKILKDAGPQRKDLHSTCGVNPGDSGGPLLSSDAKLIAVTWGIPSDPESRGVSLDKFSYHVHLDEVRQFLESRPSRPEVFVPEMWPLARFSRLLDTDNDQKPDTAQYLLDKKKVSGCFYDLDQDSPDDFKGVDLGHPKRRTRWDFEIGVQTYPRPMVFYDTDNDGSVDLFLVDEDGNDKIDLVLIKRGGVWRTTAPAGLSLFSSSYFLDESLREAMSKRFAKQGKRPPPTPTPAKEGPPPAPTPD